MQSQHHKRIAKRMPCAVQVGQRRYSGVVLNLSQGGLFIQTNANAGRGSDVGLELQAPGERAGISLSGTVAWRKVVPGQLRQVAGGGFGLRILQADERYYSALARWMRLDEDVAADALPAEEPVSAAAEAQPSWRVRVRAASSPRSRTVTVEAASAVEAREKALAHVGSCWHVIEIDAL